MPRPERRYELMRKRVDVFARALHGVAEGDVRALHRARVASRRLRELVPLLQLDDDTAAKLAKRLRKATIRLGGVRELDVLAQVVAEFDAGAPPHVLDRLRSAIDRDRRDKREALVNAGTVAALGRLASQLRDIASREARPASDASGPARGWTWAIDARIARRTSKLRAAIDAAGTVYVPARLHDVRIALKKLRYALELSAQARGLRTTPDLTALRRGQDLLGRMHDLQMLLGRAREVRDTATGDRAAVRDFDRFIETLEIECRHLHAQYLAERAALLAIATRASAAGRVATRPVRVRRSA